MASQINSGSIDGNYPIAGRDNSSSGFRTNFTNIKNNFTYAKSEIEDLQNKGIFKSNLSGNTTVLTTVNDMNGAPFRNAEVLGIRETIYDIGSVSGTLEIDFAKGSYQTITLAGSLVIDVIFNWPDPDPSVQTRMRLAITVPNANYTVTFPAEVSQNITAIAGISGNTVSFSEIGTYIFELGTSDEGTSINIVDLNRNYNTFQGNLTVTKLINNTTVTGVSITVANVNGQIVGNIYANNVIATTLVTSGTSLSLSGNLTAGNVISSANIYGTIMTPVQSNITLVGNLSSLSVTGNANVGNISVTGLTDMCGGSAYGLLYVTMVNSSSQTIPNTCGVVICNAASTISSFTLIMPSYPYNGQAIKLAFGVAVTTLTHTVSGGQTLIGGLTSGSTSGGGEWVYYDDTSTWYRIT
jgi:hypothetical protein